MGLLVPTLLFGFCLVAGVAAGSLFEIGYRAYGLTAGFTTEAALAVAAACALGAGVGGTMGGRSAGRSTAPGSRLAALMGAFGLSALASVALLHAVRPAYLFLWPVLGGTGAGLFLVRLLPALAIFLLPSALFVATLPHLARLIVADRRGFGVASGFALGLSLAGLGIGTLIVGGLFLPGFGMRGSLLMGVALAGVAASGTVLLRQKGLEGPGALGVSLAGPETAAANGEVLLDEETIAGGALAAANMLVGFAAWGCLTVWSRTLTFIVGDTVPGRAVMHGLFLVGLATGAFLIAGLADRARSLTLLLAGLLGASSIVAALSMHMVPAAASLYLRFSHLLDRPGLEFLPPAFASAVLELPAAILLGGVLALLPLVSRARGRPMSSTIGFLALGVVLADAIVGFVAIPAFGLRRSLSLAGAAGLLSAMLFGVASPVRRPAMRSTVAIALLLVLTALLLFPATWDPRVVAAGYYRYGARALARFGSVDQYFAARRRADPLFYREGTNATGMVEMTLQPEPGRPPIENLALSVDGKVEATTGDDIGAQVLQAHIPLLLHGAPDRVLLVGLLNGVTAGSILRHPVTSLAVLEREPALFEASATFADYNNKPMEDARVVRLADEARARLLAGPEVYDVIIVGSSNPWLAESAALQTKEGLEVLKSRLSRGGILALRIPLSATTEAAIRMTLRTFVAAFPSRVAFQTSREDLLLLGSDRPLAIDVARVQGVLSSNAGVRQDLARVLPLGVQGLVLSFRLGGESLAALAGEGPLNDDDRSAVEVASYRPVTVHDNARFLDAASAAWTGVAPFLANDGATPKERAGFLYNLAKAYLGAAADPVRAREVAQVLGAMGETARSRWVTGEILLQQRDIDGALREWRAVLEIDPDHLDALFSLGTYHLDNNDYPRAEGYLERAARRHGDTPVVLFTYGRALYMRERYREAIAELERLRRLPGGADQYRVIDYIEGVSQHRLKNDREAAARLEAYLKWAYGQSVLTRLEVDAHLKLAEVYETLGKKLQALQEKQKGEELLRKIQSRAQGARGDASPAD